MIGHLFSGRQRTGTVALWGKMPGCGDFIRRNLPYEQEKALEDWVRQRRGILSLKKGEWPWPHRRTMQEDAPVDSLTSRLLGQPWCFVLHPRSLPFAGNRYLIGVWMDSCDKVGREYPLVMMQAVTPRWVKQHFALQAEQPCEWLFNAARIIANSIYAQKGKKDQFASQEELVDPVAFLWVRLNALWLIYTPRWYNFLRNRILPPLQDTYRIQELVGDPKPDDPALFLDGVRFLPWADWPDCLQSSRTREYFWQQDMRGRFTHAIRI
jgi:type VI secretion system protein ImpM